MSLDNLPFNWFDVTVAIVVIVGLQRGRKNGLSVELLGTIKWLAIVFGCAFAYGPIADFISQSTSAFDRFWANLLGYLGAALLVIAVFAFIRRGLHGKLVGSDVFGRGEFYFGMIAGMLKFTCILFVVLALLNARSYSAAEIKADHDYQIKEFYGNQSDLYHGGYFIKLYTVQAQVFEKSFVGPWIRKKLDWMLITPTAPQQTQLARRTIDIP